MKKSFGEITFCLFFAVMFGMRMWGIYEGKTLYGPLLVLGFILWAVSVLATKLSAFEYLVIIGLMTLAGLVYLNTGEKGLLLYFALMLGMKGIESKQLIKAGVIVGLSGMICLTFLSSFGIIEDIAYIQERRLFGMVFRRSLGFPHPNTLSSSFTILAMMIMYLVGHSDRKRVWKFSFLLMIIAGYLYLYSGSQTGILMTTGYLALNLIYVYRGKVGIIEKTVLVLLFPLLWVVSIVGPALATEEIIAFVRSIDFNFGSRWDVGSYYWNHTKLSMFGSRLIYPEDMPYGIDMSQLYLFLQLGLVAFIVVTMFWIFLILDEVRNNRISELVITFSLLIMGVTDPFLYNISFKNIAFCFMGIWLFGKLENLRNILPVSLNREIQFIGNVNLRGVLPAFRLNGRDSKSKYKKIAAFAICAGLVIISFLYYKIAPDPNYVLCDRNYGEKATITFDGLEGQTYTSDEIRDIKAEGNIVLNYTDENELMYTYYSGEQGSVSGGLYAPEAVHMEKLRNSISITFWGLLASLVIAVFIRWKKGEKLQ